MLKETQTRMTKTLLAMLAGVISLNLLGVISSIITIILLAVVIIQALLCLPPGKMLPSTGKAVLITGCDTGIGNLLVRHMHLLGLHVYAGCLNKGCEGATKLAEEFPERLDILQMDVTNEDEVTKAVEIVRESLESNGKELWGVVNNAGINILGEIEWLDTELIKRVSEVNLWGMVRVTKATIPLLQQSKGRVVNIGSGCGLFSFPLSAPYCISKYGVESFTDVLRLELGKWGIKAIVIEPGNFGSATNLFTEDKIKSVINGVQKSASEEVKQRYGQAYFECISDYLCDLCRTSAGSADLSPVISNITEALLIEHPQHRYMPATIPWKMFVNIHRLLPTKLTDLLYFKILNYFNQKLECRKK
ncbi:D-beta-hydroxybutyrate dehydrogenase, mitochondrial-like [Antedon mediterranea]|uniref:D-beta-hydroxybutyrate dehydrogenase, mitochondrial-like n=1 Tax=Antedon mediterranea TaxID=105859 RepID=UPI003AF89B37